MWENKSLHRGMLLWSQCSQQTASPAQKTGKTESGPLKSQSKWLKRNCPCSPKFKSKKPRLHSRAAFDRPETTILPPIPEVVWQQLHETHLIVMHKKSTTNIQRKNDVYSQTSPKGETSPQVSGAKAESPPGNQTRSTPVQCPNDSRKQQPEIQRNETDMTDYGSGDENKFPPIIMTSQTEERLVRDDITNEFYMPLSSTIALKRKKKMFYVPLDFKKDLAIDALVHSGAYVSAIVQKELNIIGKQAPANIFKIDDHPNFQIQVANGQPEKPIATTTFIFDIGDHIFAEHFVVKKNLTGPITGLHFKRHNSVVIDITYGLIHFPHFTMQVKSGTGAKPQVVLIHISITVSPMTTKTITEILDHLSKKNTTGKVTPVEKFTETAKLIISHSISTIIDIKEAVRVTNTTESPYTINKNTQTADFSLVTPEQSKFIKSVDMASLNMIAGWDPNLTTYSTKLLRTNKPEQ